MSNAQNVLVRQCTTTESCKALVEGNVYPIKTIGGLAGLFAKDEQEVYEFCRAGYQSCLLALKKINRSVSALQVIGAMSYTRFACDNQTRVGTDI
ncbi:hypothetical protein SAMN06265795_1222 [Noviherbaspirillum humi]|uniref:Uncharacterized protein n=1 Tax=Noviherbaspirillum humi TaxID=1688639 RepID=A0A239LEX6_9BURK|nr:hypothetical protein [Noviherbaspirillum humi]SNT28403.1 hypothetical protein SAMN06265795_1222 [Noviherbaspirillum humi]